jgi:hypothetical protein
MWSKSLARLFNSNLLGLSYGWIQRPNQNSDQQFQQWFESPCGFHRRVPRRSLVLQYSLGVPSNSAADGLVQIDAHLKSTLPLSQAHI